MNGKKDPNTGIWWLRDNEGDWFPTVIFKHGKGKMYTASFFNIFKDAF